MHGSGKHEDYFPGSDAVFSCNIFAFLPKVHRGQKTRRKRDRETTNQTKLMHSIPTQSPTVSALMRYLTAGERVLLCGPPGIAKTAQIQAAAAAAGFSVVLMRASLSERIDFNGALVPDMVTGVTRALPLDTLAALRGATVPTLLFLDDLGQAPIDVQAAAMALFDTGALPSCVTIWGATNRPGDKAGVSALCEPLRSRFTLKFNIATPETDGTAAAGITGPFLGNWTETLEGWLQWAETAGAAPEILAWHRATTGAHLYAWKPSADPSLSMPDFRSWATVIRLWNAGLRDLGTISAAIGKPAAAEFLAFAALAASLPSPQEVAMSPTAATVPADPSALYLITTMLAAAADGSNLPAFLTYLGRLPRVFGAYMGRSLFRRLGASLSGFPAWNAWFTRNQDLFAAAA